MALVFWVGLIGFLIGGFLFRKRTPSPERERPTLPCPHCHQRAPYRLKSVTAAIECRNCGTVEVTDSEPSHWAKR